MTTIEHRRSTPFGDVRMIADDGKAIDFLLEWMRDNDRRIEEAKTFRKILDDLALLMRLEEGAKYEELVFLVRRAMTRLDRYDHRALAQKPKE